MLITIRVLPRSSKNILEWEQGQLKARLTAPPIDGAANEALIALVAERLGVPRRTISIVRGATSRQKTVKIVGLSLEDVQRRIG